MEDDLMQNTNLEQDFLLFLKEIQGYKEALALMEWDSRTISPANALESKADVIGFFSTKIHKLSTSKKMGDFLKELKKKSNNDVLHEIIRVCEEDYSRSSKIPAEEYQEFVTLQSKAEIAWQEARNKNDFSILSPYLQKLVDFNKQFANYWGYEDQPYDALLHEFEPGMTTKKLDAIFSKLKKDLVALLTEIKHSTKDNHTFSLNESFEKNEQNDFIVYTLKKMGYDFNRGRIDETIHPFEITINPDDVRITTRYDESDFRMALFSTIHEAGHALYEQNIDKKYANTPVFDGASMGIHESQSLFWENFIGRHPLFWKNNRDDFLRNAPKSFKKVSFDDFYKQINEVKASFIRIEADELTYCLHIILRYEIEIALINGELKVEEIPKLWNDKMEAYFGIRPKNDLEGVLQDIHWATGDFGYFPTYALGYMYAAQLYQKASEEIKIEELIEENDLIQIKAWLSEKVHQLK